MDLFLAILVVLLPTVFAVVLELVNEEIRKSIYWRIEVIAFGVGLSVLTAYQMIRASKVANTDRENAILETSNKVSASVSESVSKSVTKAVGDQYAQTINTLQTQIGILQGQLSTQGKSVEAIKRSNIVTGKEPIKVEFAGQIPGNLAPGQQPPEFHAAAIPTTPNPALGKNARQFILTTNKVMNGGRVRVTCKNKINQGGATIAGSSFMSGSGGGMLDDRTYQSGIGSPNWSPDFPLVITLYFDEDDVGVCQFTPLS